jgi:hypothetical protein
MPIAKKELEEWITSESQFFLPCPSGILSIRYLCIFSLSARFESHSRFQGSTESTSTKEEGWKLKELQEAGRSPIIVAKSPHRPQVLSHYIEPDAILIPSWIQHLDVFFEKEGIYYIQDIQLSVDGPLCDSPFQDVT